MNRALVIGGFVAALVGVGILSGSATPIMYGASEANTQTVGSGIFGALLAIGGSILSAIKLFTGGNVTSISDAVELLRPVLTGKSTLPEGTVRVALTLLEFDAVRRANVEDYAAVQALSKRFLLPDNPVNG